jgi:MFS family permease
MASMTGDEFVGESSGLCLIQKKAKVLQVATNPVPRDTESMSAGHPVPKVTSTAGHMIHSMTALVSSKAWVSGLLVLLPLALLAVSIICIWRTIKSNVGESGAPSEVKRASQKSVEAEKPFTPPPRRNLTFALICATAFINWMAFFIILPIFPLEARVKHMVVGIIGLCMSMFDFGGVLIGPFGPMLVGMLGPENAIVAASCVSGTLNIAFSFFYLVPNGAAFTILCFAKFFFEGFTLGVMCCANYSRLDFLFGADLSFPSSCLESVAALGVSLGPAVGGFLFAFGGGEKGSGFVVTTLVWGILELSFACINKYMLPKFEGHDHQEPDISNFGWKALMYIFIVLAAGSATSALGPTLQPHLHKVLQLDVMVVGIMFTVNAVFYGLVCIGVGHLDDITKGKAGYLFPALGASINCIGYALLAPLPLNFGGSILTLSLPSVCISMVLIGIGGGFMIAPVVKLMASAGGHERQQDRVMCAGVVFSMAVEVGTGLGQSLSGWFYTYGGTVPFIFISCLMLFSSLFLLLTASCVLPGKQMTEKEG